MKKFNATMKYAEFGSVSSGTMQPDDLIPAFVSELEYQISRQSVRFMRRELRGLISRANRVCPYTEAEDYVLEELFVALYQFAPPYGYFGAHSGDGADYGYWLSDEIGSNFDGLKVNDLSEIPKHHRGEVLHVNDHGNMSLYVAMTRGKLREIWAVV